MEQKQSNGSCVGALVCGIVALVLCFCPFLSIVGLILGIIAIILGVNGRKKANSGKNGKATAGLICGIIAIPLSIICVAFTACVYYAVYKSAETINAKIDVDEFEEAWSNIESELDNIEDSINNNISD